MTEIILNDLFPLQEDLDSEIHALHDVNYQTTKSRRLLALLVELGEFANETRCFKFWSLKGPSPKEVMLDEYADGLHFYLSLGLVLGIHEFAYTPKPLEEKTEAILRAYEKAVVLHSAFTKESFAEGFKAFLDLYPTFGFTGDEVKEAYKKKLAVNHKRQADKY
ncbi:MAG: dUTP diphosphatase [Bacilli bacterium]|nr:dUTP diphosphatase [Bacilli bacterium]